VKKRREQVRSLRLGFLNIAVCQITTLSAIDAVILLELGEAIVFRRRGARPGLKLKARTIRQESLAQRPVGDAERFGSRTSSLGGDSTECRSICCN
jgi:hypothetical protein